MLTNTQNQTLIMVMWQTDKGREDFIVEPASVGDGLNDQWSEDIMTTRWRQRAVTILTKYV